jgi:hypothetical protein
MKPLSLLILIIVSYSVRSQEKLHPAFPDFHQSIVLHFKIIDSIHNVNPDLMEQEELKFEQLLDKNKEYIFNSDNALHFDQLYIAKSADKKLCLVSWDTRMGGTMIDFTTMAIFKKENNQLSSKMLVDLSSEIRNTLMHYDTVYTVSTVTHTFYLAQGLEQGSTALPWQEIKTFK